MNKINKKLLILMTGVLAVIGSVAVFSAWEAHVINVTAHIENALSVDTTPIEFGTVFPQEYLEKSLNISLSSSFLAENRVDDVEYFIKQKPKCINDAGEYAPVDYATHECPEDYHEMLSLCPFLSKMDGDLEDNNDVGVPSYYQGTSCVTPDPDYAIGRLAKSENDTSDSWIIDLKVPPVIGFIGQDWPAGCPTVDTDSQDYGCDLWIEVTGISRIGDEDGIQEQSTCIPTTEMCDNGLDDDCDSLIDCDDSDCNLDPVCNPGPAPECTDGDVRSCYTGDPATRNVGLCQDGTQTCILGSWGDCSGDILPTGEICDGLDNDCDGVVDQGDVCVQHVFEQDFNGLATGYLNGQGGGSGFSGNWSASNKFDIQEDVTYEGAKAVRASGDHMQDSAERSLASAISQGTVYFAARKSSVEGSSSYFILKQGGAGKMYILFEGSDGTIKIYDQGSGYQTIQPFSADTWYKIAIEFDDSSQDNKYRARVYDGASWGAWTSWYTVNGGSYTSIDGIRLIFHVGDTFNEAYWDTIIGD